MERAGQTRRELESQWRERLEAAQRDYDDARNAAQNALAEWRYLPKPDGFTAMRHTSVTERAALKEYMRVLEIFHDLVVHNKMPPEE